MRAPGQKSSLKVWALAEMSAEGGLSGPPRVDLSFFRSGDAEAAASLAAHRRTRVPKLGGDAA